MLQKTLERDFQGEIDFTSFHEYRLTRTMAVI